MGFQFYSIDRAVLLPFSIFPGIPALNAHVREIKVLFLMESSPKMGSILAPIPQNPHRQELSGFGQK